MNSSADWLKALKSDLNSEWESRLKIPLAKLVSSESTEKKSTAALGSDQGFQVGMVWDPKWVDEDLQNDVTAFWVPTSDTGPTNDWRKSHSHCHVFYQNQPETRIDLKWMHDQGASRVTEIAWLMCCLDLARTKGSVPLEVRVSVDSFLFLNVAVLRLIEQLYLDSGFSRPQLSAWTSQRGFSTLDAWNNSLRSSGAAASAIWGNADFVFVSPFDAVTGARDHWGRRLARNTGLILRHEAHFSRTIDPAAGSIAISAMMTELKKQAELLKPKILADGFEKIIENDLALLKERWNTGVEKLIGVNLFPAVTDGKKVLESTDSLKQFRFSRDQENHQ